MAGKARKDTKRNKTITPALEKFFDRNSQSRQKFQQNGGEDSTHLLRPWAHRLSSFCQTSPDEAPSSSYVNTEWASARFFLIIDKTVPFKS